MKQTTIFICLLFGLLCSFGISADPIIENSFNTLLEHKYANLQGNIKIIINDTHTIINDNRGQLIVLTSIEGKRFAQLIQKALSNGAYAQITKQRGNFDVGSLINEIRVTVDVDSNFIWTRIYLIDTSTGKMRKHMLRPEVAKQIITMFDQ